MTRITARKALLSAGILVGGLSLTSYASRPQPGAYQVSTPVSQLEQAIAPQAFSESSPDPLMLLGSGIVLLSAAFFYRRKLY